MAGKFIGQPGGGKGNFPGIEDELRLVPRGRTSEHRRMSVEAVIFDIGNVLVKFEAGLAERNLAELGGASAAQVGEIAALGPAYERGELTRADFLGRLRGILGYTGPDENLARAWQDIFSPNPPMWELVDRLRGRLPLYLLSNTNCLHHDHLVDEYEVFGRFDDGVFSYRVGMSKPEPGIFELAVRQFGVRPGATVYIDDLAANVEAARAAGLLAFHYDAARHDDLLGSLRALGVQSV